MRTLVDIEESDVEALDALAAQSRQSRAALIRQAISAFLNTKKVSADEGFGLWGKRKVDGLAYQKKIRAEW